MLTLGLPVTATASIILAAMQSYGIQPGPELLGAEADLVWTLLASLLIGNTLLLVINLPLAPVWAKLLQIPRPQLYAGILFFAALGAYAVSQQAFDLLLLLVFGLVGFAIRRFGLPVLPLILGVILGPLMETKMREALDLSDGALSGLFNEALAIVVYVIIAVALVAPVVVNTSKGTRSSTGSSRVSRPWRHSSRGCPVWITRCGRGSGRMSPTTFSTSCATSTPSCS